MTYDPTAELLAAIDAAEDPDPMSLDQIPSYCVQAAALIARVVDFLEEDNYDPEFLGLARSADQLLDLLVQACEGF